MKKCVILYSILLLCILSAYGCGKEKVTEVPEVEQIRSICELSTVECIYNNVAKGEKEKGEGLVHLGEKKRKYWIEYQGYVKVGIDLSQVLLEVDGTNIKISMPDAEIQAIGIVDESFTEESIIANSDAFWNKNEITAEEQKNMIADAQKTMEEEVRNHTGIMRKATTRAKTLIENYINQIGNAAGVEYNIIWE